MSWTAPISCLTVDPQGRTILSVLSKRTYAIWPDGRTVVADEQLPLDTSMEPVANGYDETWKAELDVAPFKTATDVLVFGRAHAPHGSCQQMQVEVGLPHLRHALRYNVIGDRRCGYNAMGPPHVSAPEPFETMPLGYDRAYGGVDLSIEHPEPPRDLEEALAMLVSPPGAYPRNPVGRGYVVNNRPELVDGLLLPNIERIDQLLRPEWILVGQPGRWHHQPLPAGFGWVDPSWFPRCAFAGAYPLFPAPSNVAEVVVGHLPEDFLQRYAPTDYGPRFDFRFFNGASLGLAVPYLRGDEVITTRGLTPAGDFALRLPGDRPQPVARYRTRPLTMEVVPHTVAVMVEERCVSMVWRASAVLPRDFTAPTPSPMQPDITGLEEFELVWT
jgi:hypothetical protein